MTMPTRPYSMYGEPTETYIQPPSVYPPPAHSSTGTMELQPWSRELQLQPADPYSSGRRKIIKTSPQLGFQPAQITTHGTGQFQSTNGMVGVAAGQPNSDNFAGIITDGRNHKIQVKGDATVVIDRKNNIRAQVDGENYAEYNPHYGSSSGGKFKALVRAFDTVFCCRRH